jgi:condensin-2 complex subunit D3
LVKTKFDTTSLITCWTRLAIDGGSISASEFATDTPRILNVIGNLAQELPAEAATGIAEDLLKRLNSFSLAPELVHGMIKCLERLSIDKAPSEQEGRQMTAVWCTHLVKACEEQLRAFVSTGKGSSDTSRYLFTLGEVAMVGFDQTVDIHAATASSGPCGTVVTIPKRVVTLVQALLVPTLYTTGHGMVQIAPKVRAHAFTALGKLCLSDQRLAKQSINMLARELQQCKDAAVRSNILLLLGDLAIRYTALVDRHVPTTMAYCLADPNIVVRRHTLMVMSQLLLQDYIKWKGDMFIRYVCMLTDEDASLRRVASLTLTGPLLKRYPQLFQTHFVEAFFMLNEYDKHPAYNHAAASKDANESGGSASDAGIAQQKGFGMIGAPNSEEGQRRHQIYKVMLENMNDEQKLMLSGKLVQDVLGAALDGLLPLSDHSTVTLMADVLLVLCTKEFRLGAGSSKGKDDHEEDHEAEASGSGLEAAKGKLLSKMFRKNLAENVVPTLVGLKRRLEEVHSPLLNQLMQYLLFLCKHYKEEVQQVLAYDPQVAQEIEYDLRQHEQKLRTKKVQQQRQQEEQKQMADAVLAGTATKTPSKSPRRQSLGGGGLTGARSSPVQMGSFSAAKLRVGASPAERLHRTPSKAVNAALGGDGAQSHRKALSVRRQSLGPGTPGSQNFELEPTSLAAAVSAPDSAIKSKANISLMSPFLPAPTQRTWDVAAPTSEEATENEDQNAASEPAQNTKQAPAARRSKRTRA